MRIIFGVLGVLIALVVVGILKKKTVGGCRHRLPGRTLYQ